MDKDRKFEFGFIVGDFSEFEQVLRLRKRHSITLSELGEKLNITAQSVKEIQDREKIGTVSINVLRNVAEALGYRFEYRFVPIKEE
jgi:transcriptional regulator with XRE-family HTH domain